MHKKFILGLVLFGGLPAYTAPKNVVVTEAPLKIERATARRIFLSGFEGQVTFIPLSKGSDITVRATKYIEEDNVASGATPQEALRQLVIRPLLVEDRVEIRAVLPPSKTDWAKWAQGKGVPQVKLEVIAPESMVLEIYWARGDVKVSKWKAAVFVTNQTGKVAVEDVSGNVTVRSMFGSVKADNIHGNVTIENFSSSLVLGDISGKLKVRNFSGETHVKKIVGPVIISSQKGGVTTHETSGAMELQTGMAPLEIIQHKGLLRGVSDAGSIDARVLGEVDVKLTSQTGALTVSVPSSSKADVSLLSNKGDIRAPRTLDHKRSSAGKAVHGSLTGSEAGRVRLQSDSGDITLKTM